MATNGGYAHRKIRELRHRFLRQYWWVLALFAGFVIGVSAALAWFENVFSRWIDYGLVAAFILGVGVTAAVAMVITLMGMDGARSYREGLEAESWTRSALNRFREDGWSVFNNLEFDGWDIDHVLVGPRGVVAVETKLRNEEWTLTSTSIEGTHHRPVRWIGQLVSQTRRQARTLRSLLFAAGLQTDVRPVLVLWGRGLAGASTVTIDGVLVGLGSDMGSWFGQVRSVPLSDDQVRLARQAVERLKAGEGVRKLQPALGTVERKPPGRRPDHSGLSVPGNQPEHVSIGHR